MSRRHRPPLGALFYFLGTLMLGLYFTFAAVQGDYGLFKRIEVKAEGDALKTELSSLQSEVARMENLTVRLSDNFLDLDLLDQQARDVLGMIRADEIVIR
jgi:cell division protein FtsB